MGLLCCGDKDDKAKPPNTPTPTRIAPRLARRRSAPRPRASKQNIEQFYREGKELLRAEREQQERTQLRVALRREYEDYDEDAKEIRGPVDYGNESLRTEWPAGSAGTRSAADSMFRTTSNRRYSFETTTDRMGVRAKGAAASSPDSPRTELLTDSYCPSLNEKAPNLYGTSQEADISGASNGDPAFIKRRGSMGKDKTGRIAPNMGSYQTPSITAVSLLNNPRPVGGPLGTSGFDVAESEGSGSSAITDLDLTPKVSKMPLQSQEVSHVGLSRSGTYTKGLPKIDTDMIRAAAAESSGLVIPSEEIFARIPNLLKPSTSTFFGSSSSIVGRGGLSSPASDETALHYRYSQPSLRHGPISKKPSKSTLFIQQRVDSASSFYPSAEGSVCQSLQDSTVDIPDFGYTGPHATTMPSRRPRKSMDYPLQRARSSASFTRVGSPGFSKFSFPWNGDVSPARTLVQTGSVVEITSEGEDKFQRKPARQSNTSSVRKKQMEPIKPIKPIKPQKRTSSNRAFTGMLNFVKSGVTGEEYSSSSVSSLQNPDALDEKGYPRITTASSSTPANHTNNRAKSFGTPRGGSTARPRSSWHPKQESSNAPFPSNESTTLRRSTSLKERPSGPKGVAVETPESLGRFDHLGEHDLPRPRSLTLRKSFTHSMAKIREKVSIGAFRATLRTETWEATQENPVTPQQVHGVTGVGMDQRRLQPTTPVKVMTICSRGEDSTGARVPSGGSSTTAAAAAATAPQLRRSNTARTMPSRRPSGAARSVYSRKRDTAYDDCVIFPSADGSDDFEEEWGGFFYGDRVVGGFVPAFQREEYESERNFWRETRSMAELRPATAPGTAR